MKNPPIQNQDTIQAWTRPIHSRLVVTTKHEEDKNNEIPGMKINIDAIHPATDIPECMPLQYIQ